MRRIDYIAIHCSATPEGRTVTVDEITQWHKARGFDTIGYHYVIYLDGSVHAGRPESEAGAHVAGFNSQSIGICYVGGLDAKTKKGKDTRTPAQKAAMKNLIDELLKKYPSASVLGHRDFSPDKNHNGKIEQWEWMKDCPSFDVAAEYPQWKHRLPK